MRPWKELQLKFRALEEHLEDELLKTGKALRKDFREALGSGRGLVVVEKGSSLRSWQIPRR